MGVRNSVDSVCAQAIADFCRARSPRAWIPPPPGVRELKELTRRLYSLEQSKQEEENKLEANPRNKSAVRSIERSALCAVMRKMLHIVYGMLSHGTPFCATSESKAENSNPPTPQSPEEAAGGDAVKARYDHRHGLGRVASDCYTPYAGGGAALPDPVEIAC